MHFTAYLRRTSCLLDKEKPTTCIRFFLYLSLASLSPLPFTQLLVSSQLSRSFSELLTISAIEMASGSKVPYHRLRNEADLGLFEDYDQKLLFTSTRPRSSFRFRKVSSRRRFRLKIPSLRRVLRRAKLASAIRVSFGRVVKRLKESQSHLNDLFAGNYLFLQVNPTSLKCLDKAHDLHGLSSRYSVPRIA